MAGCDPDAVGSSRVLSLVTHGTNGFASQDVWCRLNSFVVFIVHDRRVALAVEERVAIYELMALHGHLMDAGAFDRLDELFTDDFVYDLDALGYGVLEGAKALIDASTALGDDNPLGHHVTNSLVIAEEEGQVRVRSKGIGVRADGSSGTVVYEDLVRKTPNGWRIARRAAIPRKRPLQP